MEGKRCLSSSEEEEEKAPAKRMAKERSLPIQLSEFPEWVGTLSDSQLTNLLKLGIEVHQSVPFTVADMGVKEQIQSATQPMLTAIEKKLDYLGDKPIEKNLGEMADKLQQLYAKFQLAPQTKGRVGEVQVFSLFQREFPHYTITDVSKQPGKGDIVLETPGGHKIMVEVKNYKSGNVPQSQVDKFQRDVKDDPQVKVGILISLSGGIANKLHKGTNFQVCRANGKTEIFLGNALHDENLIIWSVWLADELADDDDKSKGQLSKNQLEQLKALQVRFQQTKELEKKLKKNLSVMEENTANLKENFNLMLSTLEAVPQEIKNILLA